MDKQSIKYIMSIKAYTILNVHVYIFKDLSMMYRAL